MTAGKPVVLVSKDEGMANLVGRGSGFHGSPGMAVYRALGADRRRSRKLKHLRLPVI